MSASESYQKVISSQTQKLSVSSDESSDAVVSFPGEHASYLAKWLPATITKSKEQFFRDSIWDVNEENI